MGHGVAYIKSRKIYLSEEEQNNEILIMNKTKREREGERERERV